MGRQDFYDPETMMVRDIGEVFEDCRAVVFKKMPGTNRMVHATWAALVEAHNMYNFAHGVITEDGKDLSDRYVWIRHGEHYAAAMVIRKIADALGVSNFKTREVGTVEQVREGRRDHGPDGGPGDARVHGYADRQVGVPGEGVPEAVPDVAGLQAVGEVGDQGLGGGQEHPAAPAGGASRPACADCAVEASFG